MVAVEEGGGRAHPLGDDLPAKGEVLLGRAADTTDDRFVPQPTEVDGGEAAADPADALAIGVVQVRFGDARVGQAGGLVVGVPGRAASGAAGDHIAVLVVAIGSTTKGGDGVGLGERTRRASGTLGAVAGRRADADAIAQPVVGS